MSLLDKPDSGAPERETATRLAALLREPIEWGDVEDFLDVAGDALRAIAEDRALLGELVLAVTPDDLDPGAGPQGSYWFRIEDSPAANASLWLRFCPSGSVVPAHTHERSFVALVVHGTYKQTLIGVGGGVASAPGEVDLYVRHERPGQLFALAPEQRHSCCSSAESLLLVLRPRSDTDHRRGGAPDAGPAGAPAQRRSLIRKLRQTAARAGLG